MQTTPSFQQAQEKAELIQELTTVVEQQIRGDMDWVRSRAYWEARLSQLDSALLAEALTYALHRAAIPRKT